MIALASVTSGASRLLKDLATRAPGEKRTELFRQSSQAYRLALLDVRGHGVPGPDARDGR
mgnify:CR=1 FL=1